jgi:hypothetical protein
VQTSVLLRPPAVSPQAPPCPHPPRPDWDDASCIKILKAIRARVAGPGGVPPASREQAEGAGAPAGESAEGAGGAAGGGGGPAAASAGGRGAVWRDAALLIVESTFSERVLPCLAHYRATSDMIMLMAFGGGGERDEAQLSALLGAAGWRLARVVPSSGLYCVIEALPA